MSASKLGRRLAVCVPLAAAALLPGAASAASAATGDGFTGHWASTDVVDGSSQTLDVSGSGVGGTHATQLHDTVASFACGGGPANVQGPGRVYEGDMYVVFTVTCPGGGRPPVRGRIGPAIYTYDSASDTLSDDSGNVWHRA
jgi:hypothetical protein